MSKAPVKEMWNTKIDCRLQDGTIDRVKQDEYMVMCGVSVKSWGFGTYMFFYVEELMKTGSYYMCGFREDEEDKFLALKYKEIYEGQEKFKECRYSYN